MEITYNMRDDQSFFGPILRSDSNFNNGYLLTGVSGGFASIQLYQRVGGAFTSLTTQGTGDSTNWPITNGGDMSWRVNITGQRIRAKWWPKGSSEPTTWLFDYSDASNAVTTGSYSGFYFQRPGGPSSAMIDNFNVDDLQTSAATNFTISGSPQTVAPGTTTGNYTITPNGTPSSSVTIALSDSGGGAAGVFKNSGGTTITSLTFTTSAPQTFTYTPNAADTTSPVTITASATGGFTATQTATCNLTLPAAGFTLTPSSLSTTPLTATSSYTVHFTGGTTLPTSEVIALSDSGGGGTFKNAGGTTITSLTFTNANVGTDQTFIYTPASGTGGTTITTTASGTGQFSLTRTASCVVSTGPVTVAVNDANLAFSPYNWFKSGSSYAISQCTGAYFKLGFTGTSLVLNFDVSAYNSLYGNTSYWPKVRWSIDGGAFTSQQLNSSSTALTLASGLTSGNHSAYFCIVASQDGYDRWGSSSGVDPQSAVKITSLILDAGASTLVPTLASKRMIIFGDSITEGVQTAGTGTGGTDIVKNDSQLAYSAILGKAMDAEYGLIGFGGLGWIVASAGGSPPGAPPFFTPGNDSNSSWNKYSNGRSRLIGGLFSPAPDFITIMLGVNDRSQTGSNVTASVQAALTALRAAAPNAQIFVIFEVTTGNMKTYVQAGFDAYQLATPDSKCAIIDCGLEGHFNLTSTPTDFAQDGLHPYYIATGQIACTMAQKIQASILGASATGYSRSRIANA